MDKGTASRIQSLLIGWRSATYGDARLNLLLDTRDADDHQVQMRCVLPLHELSTQRNAWHLTVSTVAYRIYGSRVPVQ